MPKNREREAQLERLTELGSKLNRLDREVREKVHELSTTICQMVNILDNPEFDKYHKKEATDGQHKGG